MKRKIKTRPATEAELKALSIKVERLNVIVDGVSYRIPPSLMSCTDEQIEAFYRGWHRKPV